MKRLFQLILIALCASLTTIFLAPIARAQDPVKVDPDHYKVLYENNNVRILEYNDSPGHKVPKHSHPNFFVYVVSDSQRLFTDWISGPNCNGPAKTVVLKADESFPKNAVTHCEANTGYTNARLIVVEFKKETSARRTSARRAHKVKRQH
jgi:hypothetical protein